MIAKNAKCLGADKEDSDRSGRMWKLIKVFVECTSEDTLFSKRGSFWSLSSEKVPASIC